jgi:hypothetical protein
MQSRAPALAFVALQHVSGTYAAPAPQATTSWRCCVFAGDLGTCSPSCVPWRMQRWRHGQHLRRAMRSTFLWFVDAGWDATVFAIGEEMGLNPKLQLERLSSIMLIYFVTPSLEERGAAAGIRRGAGRAGVPAAARLWAGVGRARHPRAHVEQHLQAVGACPLVTPNPHPVATLMDTRPSLLPSVWSSNYVYLILIRIQACYHC